MKKRNRKKLMKRASNVEQISTEVSRITAEQGPIKGMELAISAITAYAGTKEERLFSDSQLKEIFRAVIK